MALHDVTFVVIDLETTGMSPETAAITEVGALKFRAGACLGTLQTVVNPGLPIPPAITYLTGITEAMVGPAPAIAAVLPSLLEFVGGHEAVIVGHNIRFDLSFLAASCAQEGYDGLAHPWVDTCALARRLVRDEVDNCKLGTLAHRFHLASTPTHRALDDARATADLLHCLLERAGTLGVTALDDLLLLPAVPPGPHLQKLRLATALPRAAGTFVFRDRWGNALHTGTAPDVHHEATSMFLGPVRTRRVQLIRQTVAIEYIGAHEQAG